MAHDGPSFFTVPCPVPRGSEPEPIVVWLEGEHDISTDGALCLTLARPTASEPAALVYRPERRGLTKAATHGGQRSRGGKDEIAELDVYRKGKR
jgi:hypothetical protein